MQFRIQGKVRAIRHSGMVFIAAMYFFSGLFALSIGLWFWHFLAPAEWCWISDEHLGRIQSVVFSGGLGAVLSGLVQHYIGDDRRDPKH